MKQTKGDVLFRHCVSRRYISKASIIEHGIKNYFISAERTVRKWVEKGLLRKVDSVEILEHMPKANTKMAWYSFYGENTKQWEDS